MNKLRNFKKKCKESKFLIIILIKKTMKINPKQARENLNVYIFFESFIFHLKKNLN